MALNSIVWLRNDLRIADNPALSTAARSGGTVIAVYIHETTEGVRVPGAAARWWLHHSLGALGAALAERGVALQVRSGDARAIIPALVAEHGATAVFWNRRYAPGECEADADIKRQLRQTDVQVDSFVANVLVEPWAIATGQGKPYSVFTPFWKKLRDMAIPTPLAPPPAGPSRLASPIDDEYRPPKWSSKLAPHWSIGEAAAKQRLADFLDEQLEQYPAGRDFPHRSATSLLSPHLRFGEISPRQVWHAAQAIAHAETDRQSAIDKFLSELAWRDFSYHQLYYREAIESVPMQPKYAGIAWRDARADLTAWQQGRTGLPIIDAGMRELWNTGYMQNRVRMLVASLLTKNLLIDWRLGEQWFWDCLVDADVANNPTSWQWVAGSGLDAAPYFRIFNPVTQGERFDAAGDYIRHWVPELSRLPAEWIHHPWDAPRPVLQTAGVTLGVDYPIPIVDLKTSRARALEAAAQL
ncbi:MAG TPA: deoxyribodipyrimidine photo-lyase [Devosia sp.]|jgi:deoxyribodipyrimidine photo-lyase|nr:deoxyribodipyrimidine photo-lyase [Devosia sp.]